MQLGMIGLGKMGANMARRLQRAGHEIVALDLDVNKIAELEKEGMKGATNVQQFAALLTKPRLAWLMVPSGDATESMVNNLAAVFESGDILIDGGNSYFKDDVRRAEGLKEKGIHYADVGTSGGVWGLERGYCLMIGAEPDTFAHIEPILKTLAPGSGTIEPTRGRPGRQDGAGRLSALRPGRRRPFREDGAQRHRVRPDAGLWRRLRHHANANSKDLPANHPLRPELAKSPKCGGAAAW